MVRTTPHPTNPNMQNWRRFIFLRHGQTDWNLEGRFQGESDIPLNATGLKQAQDAAGRLKTVPISRIVSSPLVRALKTAAIVAERVDLPVHVDTQLRERSFGAFNGLVVADVKRKHGLPVSEPAASILPPDAEQWPDTLTRSETAIGKWMDACPGETLLFVAHDGIFGALAEVLAGSKLVSKHGTPYAFDKGADGWDVSEIG
ncbi:MAG: histidine phosphatase family protein [Hyphomicrobiaceae bacterium]